MPVDDSYHSDLTISGNCSRFGSFTFWPTGTTRKSGTGMR